MTSLVSLVNGLIFDPSDQSLTEDAIHIEGNTIAGHGGPPPNGALILDAAGAMVCPGLIDAHLHANGVSLDLFQLEHSLPSYVASHAARRLERALRRGFTTVRDVAGGDLGLARALSEGLITGPRYLFTGRAFTQTGGHGDPRPSGFELCCSTGHMSEIVDGIENLQLAARDRFRNGAHALKIFASGGVVSPTDSLRLCQYSAPEIRAVCDEADRHNSYVAAHAYSPDAIVHAVSNGVRTIEHGNLLNEHAAQAMADADAFLVPTLIANDAVKRRGSDHGLTSIGQAKNAEVLDAGMESLTIARAAQLPIGFGTDLMGELEDDQLHEFRLRLDAGDTVESVLVSATAVNAAIIGQPHLATLAPGTPADVVVFDGNPIDNPPTLWAGPRAVIRAGEVIE